MKEDHGSEVDVVPPEFLFNKEVPLLPLFPDTPSPPPECVSSIGYSGWNPPPGNRRMLGKLLCFLSRASVTYFGYPFVPAEGVNMCTIPFLENLFQMSNCPIFGHQSHHLKII